jgi:tripartite-type tricarboxylate transporter receptor subunit TctC
MKDTPSLHRRAALISGIAFAAVPVFRVRAQPAAWPVKPVQLVVAAPAGGPSDGLARMLAEEMAKLLGQPMLIDNRPGAGGAMAAELVSRASPDGHTLMLSSIGNATGQTLLPKLNFDINRDFVHITQIAAGSNVLVGNPSTGIETLKDLVARAKSQPGKLTYASSGNGSSGHLAMEILKQRAGVSILHIPYRGGGPAMNDLLGGQVDMMFINQDAVIPYLRGSRVVPLAITSSARNPLFPSVPTVAESGYPGFEATAWAGLSAPRGTPQLVIDRIHAVAGLAIHGPFKAKQEALGVQLVGSAPAEFSAFVRQETQKWERVIRVAGIRPD